MKTQLGGDRLGSGNKQEISLRNYERSTHDLGYIWRSSMASGTLVPFMSEVGLPGDSFDIDLDCDVKTLPTLGPLFGSYKVQLDVFECPIRLYNGKLHMNMLNIGMDMSEVLLPQIYMKAQYEVNAGDNSQINSSSIYSYLNMRGLGRRSNNLAGELGRKFNAVPYLGYWDVYKNYYANKQEERGYVIHANRPENDFKVLQGTVGVYFESGQPYTGSPYDINPTAVPGIDTSTGYEVRVVLTCKYNNAQAEYGEPDASDVTVSIAGTDYALTDVYNEVIITSEENDQGQVIFTLTGSVYTGPRGASQTWQIAQSEVLNTEPEGLGLPQLEKFDLSNIDDMRMDILEAVRDTTAFQIDSTSQAPYGLGLGTAVANEWEHAYKLSSQEGLGIKTYQSDLFNNWISTEWIDGTNGVNEVTAVSTAGNEFTIDALNLANKVYNMLNRIAISGGSYDDWLDAVYTHERSKSVENPIYHGSLIKELAFEEVVSTTDVLDVENGTDQPMGTLAGRGRLTGKDKGGKVKIKVSEPSYILGIVSITPRIDYSQGNKWDVNLKTMNDLHKPALDEIGFQDLITDQMAWFDTSINGNEEITYGTAGKQPAWINYMTNVNQCRGNFAVKGNEMFMTLNRRYEQGTTGIQDLTTYVDPSKYNQIFAQTSRDSQNFWVQISNRITARRKMSAKVIPNL